MIRFYRGDDGRFGAAWQVGGEVRAYARGSSPAEALGRLVLGRREGAIEAGVDVAVGPCLDALRDLVMSGRTPEAPVSARRPS